MTRPASHKEKTDMFLKSLLILKIIPKKRPDKCRQKIGE